MSQENYSNDELVFLDEEKYSELDNHVYKEWNLLIVDDDDEIHTVTRLALKDVMLDGRTLNFLHAKSGAEAKEILNQYGSEIAIVLLDVVMETDDAGLNVAVYMREELNLSEPRIVLRTGQPGFAPEEEVIKTYDINDYKTKTELTRSKLLTTVISSLRSYQQILTINQSRLGLQKIIHSSANLLEEHSVKGFCEGIVTQISSLIGLEAEGVVCARAGSILDREDDGVYVLGAAGDFATFINERIETIQNENIVDIVNRCLYLKKHLFEGGVSALYVNSKGFEAAVYLNTSETLNDIDRQLIEIFISSVSVGYENVYLFHELRKAAFKDWLTKLPNRNQFINTLDFIDVPKGQKYNVALVDINHFSDINDGLGQEAGNDLLCAVADRMELYFDSSVKKGRVAADVFGLIGHENDINPETINELFQSSFSAEDNNISVNVTIGFCTIENNDLKGMDLLKRSNIALNIAKRNIIDNYAFFAPEIELETTNRLNLIRKLTGDFSKRRLELWYQPQIELSSKNIVGMEALLRWPDGSGGYISPAKFVPLAEYSGLIVEIGDWVLAEACRKLKELEDAGYENIRVGVNVSVSQFRDLWFVQKVKDTIVRSGCDPSNLELEITEGVVMDEPQIVIDALMSLKSSGVAIAIDDFGTGFSSLSYLQKLPIDRLKVDRSFVNNIEDQQSAVIAETIVSLATKLGLKTIAEGVETEEQATYMQELGCEEGQGFLYARPMPFDSLLQLLSKTKES